MQYPLKKPWIYSRVPVSLGFMLSRLIFWSVLLLASCDVFTPRTPEEPMGQAGTYLQPVTADIVVDNLKAAITELNATNYRRSLDPELEFKPTAVAEARDPSLWASWSSAEENSYFTTMAEAARNQVGHGLRLEDGSTELGDTRYTMDAHYMLVVLHGRDGVPDTLQGRLIWEIIQGDNGLWALRQWTDQTVGNDNSWSDLKAGFSK